MFTDRTNSALMLSARILLTIVLALLALSSLSSFTATSAQTSADCNEGYEDGLKAAYYDQDNFDPKADPMSCVGYFADLPSASIQRICSEIFPAQIDNVGLEIAAQKGA